VELNPSLTPAWDHLVWMGIARRDTALMARCLGALLRLDTRASIIAGNGIDLILLYDFAAQALRSTAVAGTPVADSVVRMTVAMRSPFWQELLAGLIQDYGLPREQIDLSRRVLRMGVEPDVASWHRRTIAFSWAARGAWDSALVAMDDYVRNASSRAAAVEAFELAAMGVWLGALDSRAADGRHAAAVRAAGDSTQLVARVAWFDGVLAAARRDRAGVAAARARLEQVAVPSATLFAHSLEGLSLELSTASARAGPMLAALERTRAEPMVEEPMELQYLTAVNRFTASRQLLLAGDTAEAAGLLAWHQAWVPPSDEGSITSMLASLGYLEEARIEKARGRPDMAREYYRLFLARYDLPVAPHQHLVAEARQALAQLGETE
jgi:hypothetical protein